MPHGLMRWTDEKCKEIITWKKVNNKSTREAAEHFKYSYSAMAQGLTKYKQRHADEPVKRAYNKKSKPLNLPVPVKPPRAAKMFELDIPDVTPLRAIPVAMVPMQHLAQFLAAACQ